MAVNIDSKCEGKLTCDFKNDMKNLENFRRLKNNHFILESKMVELRIKIQNNQIRQMQCTDFYFGNK